MRILITIGWVLLSSFSTAQTLQNLSFELDAGGFPYKWEAGGENAHRISLDSLHHSDGKFSIHFTPLTQSSKAFTTLNNAIDASLFSGRSALEVKAEIRIQNPLPTIAAIYCLQYGAGGELIKLDNSEAQYNPTDTLNWQQHILSITLVPGVKQLLMGCYVSGPGQGWFDNFQFAIDQISLTSRESEMTEPESQELSWLRKAVIPAFSQSDSTYQFHQKLKQHLKSGLKQNRIVLLGEPTHGSQEVFAAKNHLYQYLASELGYNVFTLEVTMAAAKKVEAEVSKIHGNLKGSIANLGFWCWNTPEMLKLAQFQSNYNQAHPQNLFFTGCDSQVPTEALAILVEFVKSNYPPLRSVVDSMTISIDSVMKDVYAQGHTDFDLNRFMPILQHVREVLTKNRPDFKKQPTPFEWAWILQSIRLVEQSLTILQPDNSFLRDEFMAENVGWILQHYPEAKIVVWAHNDHISYQKNKLGSLLKSRFGPEVFSIAFATGRGSYTAYDVHKNQITRNNPLQLPLKNSYEYYFEKAAIPNFYLDVSRHDVQPDNEWLYQPRLFRSVGGAVSAYQFFETNLGSLFDSVIYIDETSSTYVF